MARLVDVFEFAWIRDIILSRIWVMAKDGGDLEPLKTAHINVLYWHILQG
jgi:hypothetical protein